ncbi:MAG TPA: chemotaxis protein CheW [Ramlibacter sp.]|uniref:chemotaxis protein CheW n=1 Tax=Ramlibacter sp. TaxID=1917967 RepID=UPI002D8084FB|nr:chemotaxis protein CheW [Ramlibacter sp.]HET8745385.1 chemotaxis protein CheW [Ramlibacter sp.]
MTPPPDQTAATGAGIPSQRDETAWAAEVLRRRAEALARAPSTNAQDAAQAVQVLRFGVGEQECLLALDCLREVQPLRDLLPLPSAPSALLGVMQWRGRLLPVLDLATLLPVAGRAETRHVLVLGRKVPTLALAVGAVHGLQALAPQQVDQRAEPLEGLRPEIVRGVTREGHLFLDGPRLLALHGTAAQASPAPEHPQPPTA